MVDVEKIYTKMYKFLLVWVIALNDKEKYTTMLHFVVTNKIVQTTGQVQYLPSCHVTEKNLLLVNNF